MRPYGACADLVPGEHPAREAAISTTPVGPAREFQHTGPFRGLARQGGEIYLGAPPPTSPHATTTGGLPAGQLLPPVSVQHMPAPAAAGSGATDIHPTPPLPGATDIHTTPTVPGATDHPPTPPDLHPTASVGVPPLHRASSGLSLDRPVRVWYWSNKSGYSMNRMLPSAVIDTKIAELLDRGHGVFDDEAASDFKKKHKGLITPFLPSETFCNTFCLLFLRGMTLVLKREDVLTHEVTLLDLPVTHRFTIVGFVLCVCVCVCMYVCSMYVFVCVCMYVCVCMCMCA